MNGNIIRCLLTLALAALLLAAPAAQGASEFQREYDVEPGQKITLEMKHGGSVKAEGWDRDVVQITCRETTNGLDAFDLEVDETRRGLRFEAELKDDDIESSNLKVMLMVPREFDIEIESAGGGIEIIGVEGEFSGRTGGGGVTLHEVAGRADITTGGGSIEITDSELDGKVASGGGGGLVRDVVGNVKATSGGGVVSYQNVRDRDGDLRAPGGLATEGVTVNSKTIMYSSAGGSIKLKDAPHGAVVQTGGGRIDIRGASRFVQASTGGGNIDIEIRDGSVVARTGAGDIDVDVSIGLGDDDDGVQLFTGHGDITLTVPENLSIELDLDLGYTRNSGRDFEIDCDFDFEMERTDEWDTSQGSPRKHIYGTATINGGKHRVKIRTVNGDIRINKKAI